MDEKRLSWHNFAFMKRACNEKAREKKIPQDEFTVQKGHMRGVVSP